MSYNPSKHSGGVTVRRESAKVSGCRNTRPAPSPSGEGKVPMIV